MPVLIPEPDYYLGWMIQPIFSDLYYVYSREEESPTQNKGYYIRGSREEAMKFVEHKVKHA